MDGFGVINNKSTGSGMIIPITKSAFLTLVSSGSLTAGATYKITDIAGFDSVFLQAETTSAFNHKGSGQAWLPVYTVSGDYKGQYVAELGAVADNEIYTWGEWNYLNESGGALTPDIPDANTFDTADRFTVLTKNSTNNYELVTFSIDVNDSLEIATAVNNNTNNTALPYLEQLIGIYGAALAQTNNAASIAIYSVNKNANIYNNRVDRLDNDNLGIMNNECPVFDNYITGDDANETGIVQNKAVAISNCVGNMRVQANTSATGNTYIKNVTCLNGGYIDILSCDFHDASSIEDFDVTSDGTIYFWDVHMNEECRFRRFTFNNTVGNDVYIQDCFLNSSVILEDWTFSGGEIINIHNLHSVTIQNLNSISLNNFEWTNSQNNIYTLNLSGFTRDITDFWVDGNEGGFTNVYSFTDNPLASGASVFLNLIPNGARLVNFVMIPTGLSGGLGATLQVGVEADDVSYGLAPTVLGSIGNTVVSTVSNAATANRSLQLKAGGADITGGSVTIRVQFVLAE